MLDIPGKLGQFVCGGGGVERGTMVSDIWFLGGCDIW